MKQYFLKDTDEELQFGDELELTMNCTFDDDEELIEALLESGIIEVEDDETLDFDDEDCKALNELMESYEDLEKRVEAIEKCLDKQSEIIEKMAEKTSDMYELISNTLSKGEDKKVHHSKVK